MRLNPGIILSSVRMLGLGLALTALRGAAAQPFFETFTVAPSDGGVYRENSYPVIATLPDGRLFLAWSATGVPGRHARIVGAFSSDGGGTWSPPELIIDTPLEDCDPNIVLTADEIQVYSTSRRIDHITNSEMWKATRKFTGTQWSAPVRMPAHHKYEVGKIHLGVTLPDGTLLMPYSWDVKLEAGRAVSGEGQMELKSGVLRSTDQGQTWTPGGDMFVAARKKLSARATGGVCEPAVVLLPDGDLFALLRDSDAVLDQSRSHDGGLTWEVPSPSPLAGHNAPATLCRLRGTGEVMVVWDNSPLNRWPLAAALSTDGCKTWSKPRTLANHPGFQSGYPGATQAADGTLVAVWYQILNPRTTRALQMARFNREWLLAGAAK